jgi:hypothetical protein
MLVHWNDALLRVLGLESTPWRQQFLTKWARCEGADAAWNPLCTTQPGGEDPANPYYNTFGTDGGTHVMNYSSLASGVAATVITLRNGRYPAILQTLATETIAPGTADQIRTWGTSPFAQELDAGWTPAPTPAARDLAAVIAALDAVGIWEWAAGGFSPLLETIRAAQARENAMLDRLAALETNTGRR